MYKYRVIVEPKNKKDLDRMFDVLDDILNDPEEYEGKYEYGYFDDKSFYVDFALNMDANTFASSFDSRLVNISYSINEENTMKQVERIDGGMMSYFNYKRLLEDNKVSLYFDSVTLCSGSIGIGKYDFNKDILYPYFKPSKNGEYLIKYYLNYVCPEFKDYVVEELKIDLSYAKPLTELLNNPYSDNTSKNTLTALTSNSKIKTLDEYLEEFYVNVKEKIDKFLISLTDYVNKDNNLSMTVNTKPNFPDARFIITQINTNLDLQLYINFEKIYDKVKFYGSIEIIDKNIGKYGKTIVNKISYDWNLFIKSILSKACTSRCSWISNLKLIPITEQVKIISRIDKIEIKEECKIPGTDIILEAGDMLLLNSINDFEGCDKI